MTGACGCLRIGCCCLPSSLHHLVLVHLPLVVSLSWSLSLCSDSATMTICHVALARLRSDSLAITLSRPELMRAMRSAVKISVPLAPSIPDSLSLLMRVRDIASIQRFTEHFLQIRPNVGAMYARRRGGSALDVDNISLCCSSGVFSMRSPGLDANSA